ncbi:MAG TPA: zinc ribbon domain-containing protein [Candidatus Lokiarchaeia archaeon]|nr:zinc ribbon domain-containing protein [Candidatus Lokiarchaeia archaeon]
MPHELSCPNCGREINESGANVVFCPNCGFEFTDPTHLIINTESVESKVQSPVAEAWNSSPILGLSGSDARLLQNGSWIRGVLSLEQSGLTFRSRDRKVLDLPYSEIIDVHLDQAVKFSIQGGNAQNYEFKVHRGALPWVDKIQQILENPRLASQGGVPGTPRQIIGKGAGLIVGGIFCIFIPCAILLYLIPFVAINLPWDWIVYSIYIACPFLVGGSIVSKGIRYFWVAKKLISLCKK